MNLSTLILFLVYIINLGLLIYVLFSKNRKKGWPFFWMLVLLVLWQTTELLNVTWLIDKDIRLLTIGVQAGLLPALYLAPAFLWLVFSLFDRWQGMPIWKKILWWLPAIVMSPFVFTIHNTDKVFVGNERVFYEAGILYWFFAIYFIVLMSYGMYFLIKNRKEAGAIVRRQIDYIFFGTFLTAFFGLILNIVLPIFIQGPWYYLGINSTIFFTVTLTYALFRYRFFDIGISSYQILMDLLRLFIAGIIFYFIHILLVDLAGVDFNYWPNVVFFLVIVGLVAPFLLRLIDKVLLGVLVNPASDMEKAQDKIAQVLRSSRDMDVLFSKFVREINKVIEYKDIHIYLSKRNNPDAFYQVFPVGERLINKHESELLRYLSRKRKILNTAEIVYWGSDKPLVDELTERNVDIILPIFYNRQLLGAMFIETGGELVSIQKMQFLEEINKYLDIAIGSLLLYQQDMAEKK